MDYMKVNVATYTDAYPYIQYICESLARAVVFTTLDLNSRYWQVQMDKDSLGKMPSLSLWPVQVQGNVVWTKTCASLLQWMMEFVLGDLKGKMCFVYLYDIINYAFTFEQHVVWALD